MKGLLDILDEYFIGSVNGETEAEKYNTAYGLMVDCLYDIENIFDTTDFDIDDLDNLFEESMMEKFGYKYVVEKTEGANYFCRTLFTAEDAAAAVIEMSSTHLNYDDILEKIEFLGCNDISCFNGITVKTIKNW
jgi:hypothetical protein